MKVVSSSIGALEVSWSVLAWSHGGIPSVAAISLSVIGSPRPPTTRRQHSQLREADLVLLVNGVAGIACLDKVELVAYRGQPDQQPLAYDIGRSTETHSSLPGPIG
jgi:hypothetical protein